MGGRIFTTWGRRRCQADAAYLPRLCSVDAASMRRPCCADEARVWRHRREVGAKPPRRGAKPPRSCSVSAATGENLGCLLNILNIGGGTLG